MGIRKYDCYQTLDFVKELDRMCNSFSSCEDCPINANSNCRALVPELLTKADLDKIQEWSDTHSEKEEE